MKLLYVVPLAAAMPNQPLIVQEPVQLLPPVVENIAQQIVEELVKEEVLVDNIISTEYPKFDRYPNMLETEPMYNKNYEMRFDEASKNWIRVPKNRQYSYYNKETNKEWVNGKWVDNRWVNGEWADKEIKWENRPYNNYNYYGNKNYYKPSTGYTGNYYGNYPYENRYPYYRPEYKPVEIELTEPITEEIPVKNYWSNYYWNKDNRVVDDTKWVNNWWGTKPEVVSETIYEAPIYEPVEIIETQPLSIETLPTYEIYPPMPPPPAPMDPFMMMMLMNDNTGDKMSMLLPLMMSRQNQPFGNGNGNDIFSNPLFLMTMMDDQDTETCEDKHNILDEDAANPDVDDGDALIAEAAYDDIDFFYIGCLHHKAEAKKDGGSDLLLPLMMQGMNGNGAGNAMDPMMLMLLSEGKMGSNLKKFLPFLMSNGFNSQNIGPAFQMDPAMMMLFLEEAACELKYDIPTKYYVRNILTNQMDVVTDKSDVKEFYQALDSKYKVCSEAAGTDDKDDMLFWMMMMGGMPTAM